MADNTEAVFIELPVRQLMQSVHHVVMAAHQPLVNSRSVENRQLKRPFQVEPAMTVRHSRWKNRRP
jgi:hypothetical protein